LGHNESRRAELWAIAAVRVTTAIESDAKSVVLGLRVAISLFREPNSAKSLAKADVPSPSGHLFFDFVHE